MASLPLQTYASQNRPLWQPFGTTAPPVSSFTDASISTLTVSTINGIPPENLDTAAWAFFPAAANVDMNSNTLSNVRAILGQTNNTFNIASQGTAGMNLQVGGSNSLSINTIGNVTIPVLTASNVVNRLFTGSTIQTNLLATSTL